MSQNGRQGEFRLGFLTAVEVPERGFIGGLLVTNRFGRPLEFQCTSPVRPNRSQEILYGPTLKPFLLGELIGGTLLKRAGVQPDVLIVDRPEMLELRPHISVPVGCLREDADGAGAELRFGRQRLRFHAAHEGDRERVEEHAPEVGADADLSEPFGRVREALKETLSPAARG